MSIRKTENPAGERVMRAQSPASAATPASPESAPAIGGKAARYVASGNYQKALDHLRSARLDPALRNVMGVCLLRLGKVDEAVRVFRELVLHAGCTWVRPDVPTVYITNYATALLLQGHPSGCQDVLASLTDLSHPTRQKLLGAINAWSASLGFWQRLNWRFGRIEPGECHIPIDFVPGDLDSGDAAPDTYHHDASRDGPAET
ncbi:MAG: tetratricopeptide repeat protein [Pirellulaceae bacterium]|jgi:hypothetical protein|nr:tetratricopeptide repeat protein [Pirellulaceae bacterium]